MQPGSGPAARRRLAAIRAEINLLRQHPCLHPIGDHPGVRELPCAGGYRALYRVTPDTGRNDTAGDVRILRVFGPDQSRERTMSRDPKIQRPASMTTAAP